MALKTPPSSPIKAVFAPHRLAKSISTSYTVFGIHHMAFSRHQRSVRVILAPAMLGRKLQNDAFFRAWGFETNHTKLRRCACRRLRRYSMLVLWYPRKRFARATWSLVGFHYRAWLQRYGTTKSNRANIYSCVNGKHGRGDLNCERLTTNRVHSW
jgi:hypothetical protein